MKTPLLPGLVAAVSLGLIAALTLDLEAAEPASKKSPSETVLFPFDDHALPFNKGLVLSLMPGRKSAKNPNLARDARHPGRPVLKIGKPGDPDEKRAYFFGTVLHVDGEYRMWYSGHDGRKRQICYAVSKDGLVWEKPKLGLVEYRGNKENNLVAVDGAEPMQGMGALVLHEPEDPDPKRRFKMIREINPEVKLATVSADGVRWKTVAEKKDILLGGNMEPSGLIKFKGAYYLSGHGGPVPHPIPARGYMRPQKRMMVTVMSYDFEHWTLAGHVSFRRDDLPPRPMLDFEFHRGEQVHLGASVWNRGNVLLGFYGQYHNPTNDRRTSIVDLGFIVSHDALHYKEPMPDFKMVPSFEEEDRAEPRLVQGQAFHNIGDRTFVYYGIWTENNRDSPTGIRVATWPRDRLGYYSPAVEAEEPHCISMPVTPSRPGARVFLNATGLSEESRLTVELLDEQFRPLPGYTAADFVPIAARGGLRFPMAWRGQEALGKLDGPIRVRVNWSGAKAHIARLFAIYVE